MLFCYSIFSWKVIFFFSPSLAFFPSPVKLQGYLHLGMSRSIENFPKLGVIVAWLPIILYKKERPKQCVSLYRPTDKLSIAPQLSPILIPSSSATGVHLSNAVIRETLVLTLFLMPWRWAGECQEFRKRLLSYCRTPGVTSHVIISPSSTRMAWSFHFRLCRHPVPGAG